MSNPSPGFRRLVLGLQPGAPDRSLRFAVELAGLLRLELLGLFLDDSSLRDLARIPFAREFRGPLAGWQPIELERVSRDLEVMAASLKRMFEEAARELATEARFEVARGSLRETIGPNLRTDDILMLVEPASAAERVTCQFAWLTEAAFRSAAAVLLVPPRVVRNSGPVVAIAARPDDPSIQAAAAIATVAKEKLVIIDADHHDHGELGRKVGVATGLDIERFSSRKGAFPDAATCTQAFRHLQERLVVVSRGAFDDSVASVIASTRQVPVLVIEQPQEQ
jgi:hypothetical protein